MKLVLAKSTWEVSGDPLARTLGRIAAEGYDAVEIYLAGRPESDADLRRMLRDAGLIVIAQIHSGAGSVDEQCRALTEAYEHALRVEPRFVNCQTGRDWFSFDDNRRIFERASELVARHGVPICHETHRGRALFCLPVAARLLEAMPEIRLTADLSHWFCVHESDLRDQEPSLARVIDRVDHVHARVGFAEGPQVSDPRNPGHAKDLARHVELWRRILRSAMARGLGEFTVTPEFGPVPYTPLAGREDKPCADAWEINGWMRDYLRATLHDA